MSRAQPRTEPRASAPALRRGTLTPERLPEFPPRSAAEMAAAAAREAGTPLAAGKRRRFPFGLALAVVIAATGAGVLVGLDPFAAPKPKLVEKAVAAAVPLAAKPTAPTLPEAASVVAHTGALVASPPVPMARPAVAAPQQAAAVPEAAMASVEASSQKVAAPPAPGTLAAVPVEAPAALAPGSPPQAAASGPVVTEPEPSPRAAMSPAPKPAQKAAESDALVTRGERFLQAGDLASARLFFGRAAQAGDARGARGLAQTYDPTVVRKLPVYGLPVDQREADAWYARASELEKGKAFAQQ